MKSYSISNGLNLILLNPLNLEPGSAGHIHGQWLGLDIIVSLSGWNTDFWLAGLGVIASLTKPVLQIESHTSDSTRKL